MPWRVGIVDYQIDAIFLLWYIYRWKVKGGSGVVWGCGGVVVGFYEP